MGDSNAPHHNYKMFKCFNRKFKASEAGPPPDVKAVFAKYAQGGDRMSIDQFRTFLVEHQGESALTISDAHTILLQFTTRHPGEAAQHKKHVGGLSLQDFFHFLFLEEFNAPIRSQVHHDMNAPVSHYFIYTGHNSYLTGNQLSSDCSDVPIIKALQKGVKVIELDLWPNSAKDDVQVYHGRTLTAPVTLIKCLKSIKEHAFDKSPYPVVITFEDHLTPKLQAKVAELVIKTFGDTLHYPEAEDQMVEFPSPESLKNRIIISTKPPKECSESKSSKGKGSGRSSSEESGSDQDEEAIHSANAAEANSYQQSAPEYKRLITIHAGKPSGELKDALAVGDKVRRLSLSEQKLEKAAEDHGTDVVRFTQKNVLRVYPKGTRFNSSNYEPHVGWMHGAQMVAFNMQGKDKYNWLMHGMFKANGGCGYLKKPDFLMCKGPKGEVFDPKNALKVKKTLKVKIYMGNGWHLDFSRTHFDSFSPPDFYTKVYIVGVPADCGKFKTKIIEDDWIPVWDEEFAFPMTVPELAILRLEVREYDRSEKDDFGGQTCLPVSELKPGIRAVPLYDKKGEKYKSVRLLIRRSSMSKQTYKVCFCFQRRFKLAVKEAPPEIKALFDQYSENGIMTADHFHRFLTEVQKEESATKEEAQALIEQSLSELKHLNIFHRKVLNLEAFFKYLFGDINPPVSPALGVHHDMNAPLSHYFIYTGHNSYLTGNQLSSDCSDVPIIQALHRGVRVIELDIWPNSNKDDVDVLHGGTLTTPVELIKCLKSIKEHAFVASEYPVVITLEDHLTPDLQTKVAKMVTETFGEVLFSPGSECLKEFPSPASLKKRIIISTKPPQEYREAKDALQSESDPKSGKPPADEEAWGKEVPDAKGAIAVDDKHDELDEEDSNEEEDVDNGGSKSVAPEYKRLIAIHAGKPKGGLAECLKVDPNKVRRLSLSEQQLEKAAVTYGKEIVRFTQRNILRVYPKGIRVDSSNYNPMIGWSHGAQMVAFNMQGYGRSLWLMQGMFRANGGCGYVKKPDFLLKSGPHNEVFDPKSDLPVKQTLKVKVYMGEGWYYDFKHTHFDAYSPPDFYARVGIAGVAADSVMKKTKTLEDDWSPAWNEEFAFPLTVPELAVLRVEVHEYDMSEKDDFGGQTCLPVSELRTGIRAVPLNCRKGVPYKSVKLLMHFDFV
ncbi:hypothetical protein DVH24_022946 [Malus domestica]|uniref:Phosphoinositide phospholipase C n=2 Tax=Malus domestica TaxID=3750 RepID=A0A498KSY7_MALDO|nr:hypothetical protein DVH24_022946 [Malus domestica]